MTRKQKPANPPADPRQSPGSEEWVLQFSRRLGAADETFSGIVVVSVDAAYFVSGYESSKLGARGVLGILGTDGVFRARRSGEAMYAGDIVDFATVVGTTDETEKEARLSHRTEATERKHRRIGAVGPRTR